MMSSELPLPLFQFTEFTGESHDYEEQQQEEELEVLSFEEVMLNFSLPPQQSTIIQKVPSTDFKLPGKNMTETNTNRIQSFDRAMSRSGEDFHVKQTTTFNKIDTKTTNQWKSSPNTSSWNTKSQSMNNRNLNMTPTNAALQLLNSKDVASKVTGKRPSSLLNDYDFPPISLSNSTTPHSSNKKHQTNNIHNYSMPATTVTTPTNSNNSTTSSFYNYSPCKVDDCQNVLFAPQQITKQAFEDRKSHWHYFRCDLQLDEIIQQMDHELQKIAETEDEKHHYQHSLYQQLYMYYQPFQYTWMLFYCQSIEQCELKIKIYRILDTENDLEFMDNDTSSIQYFLPQHYIITFEQINGSNLLFKQLFERLKLSLGTYDDCWTKDLTVSVQSKCVLMSPTEYYYYQHAKADSSTSLNGSCYTTPSTSEKCREVLNCPPQSMTSSTELLGMLTHADFYADPTNIAQLDEWISKVFQYETKLEQFEAIQHLCQLCHAAHEEKKFLTLLEQLGLIEALMSIFFPSASTTPYPPSTPTAAAVFSSPQSPVSVGNEDELTNDLYSIKLYVVQMLLYFTQREQAVRKMLKDQHFIGFITSVVTTSSPHFNSFEAGSATAQLKWMKLSRDCQRLSEELCKMIQTDDEVGEYDDGMIFSPKNNHHHHHHHHHHGGSNHQLKSKC